MGKRLMFLYYILTRHKNELVSKVYFAQKKKPVKDDWYELIKSDLKEAQLEHYNEEEIKSMKKPTWKKIVKTAIKHLAFEYLKKEAKDKSKMKNLNYSEFDMQSYLKSQEISKSNKMLLFKLRTRMIDIEDNFGKKTLCAMCKLQPSCQSHLFECIFIKLKCPEIVNSDCEYADIFKNNINKMNILSKIAENIIRQREIILENEQCS